jgi:lysozyme
MDMKVIFDRLRGLCGPLTNDQVNAGNILASASSANILAAFLGIEEKTPMNLSEAGYTLIKQSEGLRLKAYKDSKGVPTIGWGHTKGVSIGQEINYAKAAMFLEEDVKDLNQNQFDALVSFTFNLGTGALAKSTLLTLLNSGDYIGAANQLPRWNKTKVGGMYVVEGGLSTRRENEKRLFLA